MRRSTLLIALVLCVSPAAHADVGLGFFVGDPAGIDLKIDLQRRSALDILVGWAEFDNRVGYGHVTYLVTPVVGHGDSVLVPLRLGIGGAVFGPSGNLDFGVRAPLEVALRFRSAPIEIYGEIALILSFHHPGTYLNTQGGLGLRFYF